MTDLVSGKNVEEDVPEDTYYYTDATGRVHLASVLTGEVIKSTPDEAAGYIEGNRLSPQFEKGNGVTWHYSKLYHDLVAEKIIEGLSLTQISRLEGFPNLTILTKWRAQYPAFNEAITLARKAKAQKYEDMIEDSLEATRKLKKDEIPAEKLWLDKAKWLAEKHDPQTYGTKRESTTEGSAPVHMTINTGVPLDEGDQPITIEVEPQEKE